MRNSVKKYKIHFRTMLNIVVLGNVLGALLVVAVCLGYVYYNYIKEDVLNRLTSNVEQVEKYLSSHLENVIQNAEMLTMDVEFGKAVEQYCSEELEEIVEGRQMLDYVFKTTLEMSSFEAIAVVTDEKLIMRDPYGPVLVNENIEKVCDQDWYTELLQDEITSKLVEGTFFDRSYQESSGYLYATKFKNKYYQSRRLENRLLIVNFDLVQVQNFVKALSHNNSVNIHICYVENGKQHVLFQSWEDAELAAYLENKISDEKRKQQIEKEIVFLERESQIDGFRIVGCISDKNFYSMVYRVEPWILMLFVGVLALSMVLSYFSAKSISRPIGTLVSAMKGIENSRFTEVESKTSCQEIEELNVAYNRMAHKLEELIENIRQQEKEKRKIEYRILEAQINPHFIYNTLDAVKWMAHVNRAGKLAEIIESFVRLLRLSLSGGTESITVENELILIREYVNIMIFRNNTEVDIQYEIAEETLQCSTLKLVMQPFVENSFLHAFENIDKENKLCIKTYLEEDALVFEIKDNGNGFSMENRHKQQMTGIGIANIDERIKGWHGNRYGVEIQSGINEGTCVVIRQPILWEKTKGEQE